jgi:hypothetical protein
MPENASQLKVFLCHASEDKPKVLDAYYQLLKLFPFADYWIDSLKLLPGQDWKLEITRALEESHVVLVFISKQSTNKTGYLNRELREVLDLAELRPEGAIFAVPVRLEECNVPSRLTQFQRVDIFQSNGFSKLERTLSECATSQGVSVRRPTLSQPQRTRAERRLLIDKVVAENQCIEQSELRSSGEWIHSSDWLDAVQIEIELDDLGIVLNESDLAGLPGLAQLISRPRGI